VKLLKQFGWTFACLGTSLKRGVNAKLLLVAAVALISQPESVRACAACYGQSDSPLASGVTWGILSLLVVVMGVLGSIVTFFVFMNKRAALAAEQTAAYQSPVTRTNY
jgi:hypothetical protein